MEETAKQAADVVAATVTFSSLLGFLPPLAAFVTLIYTLIRIYETDTVRGIRNGRNSDTGERRIDDSDPPP